MPILLSEDVDSNPRLIDHYFETRELMFHSGIRLTIDLILWQFNQNIILSMGTGL
jgi:hypothetical protein